MKYSFVTIEGNIGAGKTTLANILSQKFNAKLVLEAFADNPFLPKFYEQPEQYAFPLELFFMAERYKQLKELLHTKDMFQSITISDYLFTKCLLFAKVNLPEVGETQTKHQKKKPRLRTTNSGRLFTFFARNLQQLHQTAQHQNSSCRCIQRRFHQQRKAFKYYFGST